MAKKKLCWNGCDDETSMFIAVGTHPLCKKCNKITTGILDRLCEMLRDKGTRDRIVANINAGKKMQLRVEFG